MRASRFLLWAATVVLGVTACSGDVPVTTIGPPSTVGPNPAAMAPDAALLPTTVGPNPAAMAPDAALLPTTVGPNPAAMAPDAALLPTTVVPPPEPPPPTALLESSPTSLDPPAQELPDGERTRVEDVVDGDTIVVTGGTRVRLIGVDTPENQGPPQACAVLRGEGVRLHGVVVGTRYDDAHGL